MRLDLKGHLPVVEYRREVDRYFVTFPTAMMPLVHCPGGTELVMAFEHKMTARELAIHVYHGSPFYTHIPVVPYQTPFPRPWLAYPRITLLDLDLVLR